MHEMIEKIEGFEKKLLDEAISLSENGDAGAVATVGAIVDMVKDLAEAKKNCFKACYYKSVVDAMDEQSGREDRDGYNPRRYSTGRYAPAGKGHISGYMPPLMDETHRMGYVEGAHNTMTSSVHTEPLMQDIRRMIADAPESERQHLKREVDKMFS